MPLIHTSAYKAPFLFRNGHIQTIAPSFIRRLESSFYQRERIDTPDDDFLDLDWSRTGNSKLAVISHGLEGNSRRHYVVGMARMLNRNGWDALAWNYRGCSGEINRRLRMYHNGSIDDLESVIQHALKTGAYRTIALVGFSLGGNLTLLYLGRNADAVDDRIKKAVVFSVPCDLRASALELGRLKNKVYMVNFLATLHAKIRAKMEILPGQIDDDHFHRIRNFKDFDDRYTAPIHGFKDAEDYWQKCSSGPFIPLIKIPTLIVNAQDDPFLSGNCYPLRETTNHEQVFLEMPESGGHVGFVHFNRDRSYWSEQRAIEFLQQA